MLWKWLLDAGQTLEKYEHNPIASFEVQFYDTKGERVGPLMKTNVRYGEGAQYAIKKDEWIRAQEYGVAMRMRERFRDALLAQARTK